MFVAGIKSCTLKSNTSNFCGFMQFAIIYSRLFFVIFISPRLFKIESRAGAKALDLIICLV